MPKLGAFFRDRKVWVSGHTGFKGSWLTSVLIAEGAVVRGYSIGIPTQPALFDVLGLEKNLEHELGDIRNSAQVTKSILAFKPEFVFHLAAQPLVRKSYLEPKATFDTNVGGTISVLEALRGLEGRCTAIIITTDKCYENREWHFSYRENDPLGGYDPYSASKAAAEIVIAAYRSSFFPSGSYGLHHQIAVASVRAGNVIGGGDWAEDRIVPDAVRALSENRPIPVRNPASTRPWQHVLEPVSGYLQLAASIDQSVGNLARITELCASFNLGPSVESNRDVKDLVHEILKNWRGEWVDLSGNAARHESKYLSLAIDKAYRILGWRPRWGFERTVQETVAWYKNFYLGSPNAASAILRQQITSYFAEEPS